MSSNEFVAIYNAATNIEAHLVKLMLDEAGIDAQVAEDHSPGGFWSFGLLPEIHKPQIWVKAEDAVRGRALIEAYEDRAMSRDAPHADGEASELEVVCEDCGQRSTYPAAQRGSIQECPRCGGYVDVGFEDEEPYWQSGDDSVDR